MKKVLLIMMVVILLVGCSENPLEGSWKEDTAGIEMIFEGDECSFVGQTHPYRIEDDKIIMTVDGIEQVYYYQFDEDILVISIPELNEVLYFNKQND
ncbi:lipocalin-like domain-containing protein [Acidaminobacter sp. JC074]|uniref:lipocalin-like domain-containing protein n=1 Tax=Acidaminobacter sp. JC074 TaxID=2530199 RepID=UPI001F0D7FB8|nr:lipocalin-like domain-containing protein [Acidaminobacter sp. JC074]MCH4886894.1 lipocalin-like domain-containing protein [Acidaminobacter sp. JC074]